MCTFACMFYNACAEQLSRVSPNCGGKRWPWNRCPGARPGAAHCGGRSTDRSEMSQDSLVESRSGPSGAFGAHKQNVSPTGDTFS
ncbi:MAG: hypothetical protein AB1563_14265 [Bacillota bacterium]